MPTFRSTFTVMDNKLIGPVGSLHNLKYLIFIVEDGCNLGTAELVLYEFCDFWHQISFRTNRRFQPMVLTFMLPPVCGVRFGRPSALQPPQTGAKPQFFRV